MKHHGRDAVIFNRAEIDQSLPGAAAVEGFENGRPGAIADYDMIAIPGINDYCCYGDSGRVKLGPSRSPVR